MSRLGNELFKVDIAIAEGLQGSEAADRNAEARSFMPSAMRMPFRPHLP